jgi:dephospho-CoA kinase
VTIFVGLTGGIGAGKSTALAALERLGAAVLSTDDVVHELYGTEEVRDAVVAHFGDEVATPAGGVDRGVLARRAFATETDRRWLEGLLWPLVGARMQAWRAQVADARPPVAVAVVEVPLLFEAGLEPVFDATITVLAPDELRRARAEARGHAELEARGARQLSQEQKAARSTYVVVNDRGLEELETALSSILGMLSK